MYAYDNGGSWQTLTRTPMQTINQMHLILMLKLNTMQLAAPGGNHCCLMAIVYR